MAWWLNASSVILILGSSTACITAIIYACCSSMRSSRCKKIKCCCFECDREIMSDDLAKMELEHQQPPVAVKTQPPNSSQEV